MLHIYNQRVKDFLASQKNRLCQTLTEQRKGKKNTHLLLKTHQRMNNGSFARWDHGRGFLPSKKETLQPPNYFTPSECNSLPISFGPHPVILFMFDLQQMKKKSCTLGPSSAAALEGKLSRWELARGVTIKSFSLSHRKYHTFSSDYWSNSPVSIFSATVHPNKDCTQSIQTLLPLGCWGGGERGYRGGDLWEKRAMWSFQYWGDI